MLWREDNRYLQSARLRISRYSRTVIQLIQLWQMVGSDLTFRRCFLATPPSAAKGNQMTSSDIREISKVPNVRIFVEKAIARMKWFRILKTQLPLLEMPLLDDIGFYCCNLVNFLPPINGRVNEVVIL